MKTDKNENWLNDALEKAIGSERKKADFESFKTKHNQAIEKLISRAGRDTAVSPQNVWRIILKSRIAKFAAAAVLIIAVFLGINFFGGSIDGTSKVYAMSDIPELFQTAKTIHMKGRMYFPTSGREKEQVSVAVEYWLDTENGRWRTTYPGYRSESEGVVVRLSECVSDGDFEMHLDHADKKVTFSKLTPYQRRLFARKNIYTSLELCYVNFDLFDYKKTGQEIIDGEVFDIWEAMRKDNTGTVLRLKSWLSPSTGDFARIKSWVQMPNGDLEKQMEIELVERDIEIPDAIFATSVPNGYITENSKEIATVRELSSGSVSNETVCLNCHILFLLPDYSVILGWSSEDKQSDEPQAKLFEDLEIGGLLPKLAAEVYAIKAGSADEMFTYRGYHLACTQKKGKFYEWSIYVSEQQPTPKNVLGYQLVHRYNPEGREVNAKISLAVAAELTIENAEDFATFVRGAMADLSDNEYVPEHVTYENVLELAKKLRFLRQ